MAGRGRQKDLLGSGHLTRLQRLLKERAALEIIERPDV